MNQQSFVSIIIPAFNAQKFIGSCLDALIRQNYPKDRYEIIVIDNGSTDKTLDIIKKYPVTVQVKTKCNISRVRNQGAELACGDIFAFIDSDCIAPDHWLSEACQLLQLERVGAVGCWYALPESTTLIERVWDMLSSARREKSGPIDWVPSSNFFISKKVFEKINGFDELLITCEDVEICQRVIKNDLRVYSSPKIAVKHLGNPKTLKQFFFKEKWRGEGVLQHAFRNFPHIDFNKAVIFGLISFLSVLSIILGIGLWILGGNGGVLFISTICLFFIPTMLTIKTLYQRSQWDKFFILLLLFTVYGIARGVSVCKFIKKESNWIKPNKRI